MSSPSLNMHLILPNWQFKKATTAETGKVFSSKAKKKKKNLGIISIITLSRNDHRLWKCRAPPPLPKPRDLVPITFLKEQQSLPWWFTAARRESSEGSGLAPICKFKDLNRNGSEEPQTFRTGISEESQKVLLLKNPLFLKYSLYRLKKKRKFTVTKYVNLSIFIKNPQTSHLSLFYNY